MRAVAVFLLCVKPPPERKANRSDVRPMTVKFAAVRQEKLCCRTVKYALRRVKFAAVPQVKDGRKRPNCLHY